MPHILAVRPDTALADAADRMLVDCSPPHLVGHCHRTYQFAAALLGQQGRAFDAEALYVACALHDLGLTPTWDDPVTPFEARGARVAHDALLAWQAPTELADLVRDAIALHLELATRDDARAGVAGVSLGAGADVAGLSLGDLPPDVVGAILEQDPREPGFKDYLTEVIRAQAAAKPTSRIARHVADFSFDTMILTAPFDN
ncbi:HD domain-containing protein [Frankia sp. CNm7]|uniref:HD domain-containing protein n=1 Tax=Frankia nepalensis TaxID=1836974 RepID=A0A937RQH7_9ACTN|nr:HD domain-containing protein [Frankia nepalensis]MBL7498119.1 HD domain-containing protein [Frankia nepalensis]MBL7509266.1 HD domain-containing protein [Frankia nepalensis]MBL7522749.1 HD domain-containing protein [Frankia nepalensis]MBL7630803.1 HD domain-containing protein [Frankia nepalensis]